MILGKITFIAALILQIIIRYPYRNNRKSAQADWQEKLLLIIFTIGGLLLPLIYIFTDWLTFADYPSSIGVVGIGVILMIVGLWLFWRSHTDLGHNWSPTLEIQDKHTLVTQGVYQRVRHPMYSASWVMLIAQALILSNWIAGLGGLITFALLYFSRISKEEEMMIQAFGEQYQVYMQQTGRIIPRRGQHNVALE